jgi:hypothetical protein
VEQAIGWLTHRALLRAYRQRAEPNGRR